MRFELRKDGSTLDNDNQLRPVRVPIRVHVDSLLKLRLEERGAIPLAPWL
jgi:hypothetical protein